MNSKVTGRAVAVAVVAVLLVGALAVGAAVARYDQPRVEAVDSEFGDVGDDEAAVHTSVVVQNPNDRPVPGAIELGYVVALNDVEVASGTARDVRLEPGRTTVETTATFDNSRIPEWWVSHVNNGEETTMTTRARVGVVGSLGPTVPVESRTIETDLLGPLAEEGASTVALGDREILVVGDQRAEWGEADAETTPLRFATDLENVHDRPVRLDGTDYEVRMNGVVVGEGETTDGVALEPGESATFEVDAAIDTPRMQEWWVTHLRGGESTDLEIEVYAVVDDGDERRRLPLAVFDRQATFETDLLGGGEASLRLVEGEPEPTYEEPRVEATRSEWGDVRDDETDIRTAATVVNENDEEFSDLLDLVVEQRTTLAGVTVAEGTQRVETLPRGTGEVEVVTTKSHDVVPEWWAAHLRNGEVSEIHTALDAEADVGVTTLPLALDDRSSTVETDLLGDLDDDTRRREGPLVVHSTSAEWVDPTPEEATVVVEADVENSSPVSSVTVGEVDYVVDINDVTLADDRAPEEHTFAPGERRTVEFTLVLDNSRMAEWWPTHVRRGEVSEVDRQVTATIESDGQTERRELGFLSEVVEVETDLLADENE